MTRPAIRSNSNRYRAEVSKLCKALGIQRTPDETAYHPYTPKILGKRTQLGICKFFALLFILNEKLPRQRKMTDEEIKRQALIEFPNAKSIAKLRDGQQTVNYHRDMYNRGRYTAEEAWRFGPPSEENIDLPLSYRYNSTGDRTAGNNIKRLLPDELQAYDRTPVSLHASLVGGKDATQKLDDLIASETQSV
jgi:hypothetical protein